MIAPSTSSRRGFTLIELLVVISILAILMGILIPAVTGALENAKKTQARNDAVQIATALNAYFTEYGRFPEEAAEGSNANTEGILAILSGKNETANPRGLVFLEIPRAKAERNGQIDGKGPYKDPWGGDYEIRVDTNYDNKVTGPSGEDQESEIQKTVIVWTKGNPRKDKDYKNPAKWIKSYE